MDFDPINEHAGVHYIVLAGRKSPGVAEIRGAELKRRLSIRKSYGMSGSTVVDRGRELVRFDVLIQLCEPQDFLEWESFSKELTKDLARNDPDAPGRRKTLAYDIEHPVLALVGVAKVLIETIRAPEQVDDGVWEVKLGMIEYREPKLALAKVKGSKATPVDPVEADIESLDREAQELRRQLEDEGKPRQGGQKKGWLQSMVDFLAGE